jgi:hypothetical protein
VGLKSLYANVASTVESVAKDSGYKIDLGSKAVASSLEQQRFEQQLRANGGYEGFGSNDSSRYGSAAPGGGYGSAGAGAGGGYGSGHDMHKSASAGAGLGGGGHGGSAARSNGNGFGGFDDGAEGECMHS